MNQTGSFIAITERALLRAPVALQKYVQRFFKREMIFGTYCWVAFRTANLRPRADDYGVAPLRSVDVNCFTEGLPEGITLSDVIEDFEKDPRRCFSFLTDWDDKNSGPGQD